MTTAFKKTISICGLTQSEAANFLGVRIDTVKSWCADRNTPPAGAWRELADLYDQMQCAVEAALELIEEKQPDEVEISYSGEHGRWPSVGCAMTIEAMIRLELALE